MIYKVLLLELEVLL